MTNQVTKSITVNREIGDVYRLWANFENFPSFMEHIDSVSKIDDRTSHWVMNGPLGILFSWNVETTTLEENKKIAWNTKDREGDVKTSGQVEFEPVSEEQTEVTVTLKYVPPAGAVGEMAAELIADPENRLVEDLKNFKEYAETVPEPAS